MASCLFPERGWGEHVPLLALLGEKVAGEEVLGEVKRLASREDVVLEHRGRQVDVAPVVKQADCVSPHVVTAASDETDSQLTSRPRIAPQPHK